ncbi:MAG: winged helix-turn-helix domain-containing protein [Dehalococcoidales bacterium]|nr:MAG: winged helix-turn-helix domain-containing protein [Dehalococcoidales bacterium]
MTPKMSDHLRQRVIAGFVGRTDEKAILLNTLEQGGPLIVFVHGIAGVGKTSLLEIFSAQARAGGATVVGLDCRSTEPTERGFIYELGAAIGSESGATVEVAERLGQLGERVVLALDNYHLFRLADTWLRQGFIPGLPDNVRVILCGREPPVSAWLTQPEWQGLFRSIPLGPLGQKEAIELLSNTGVSEPDAQRINRLARGHPLALRLAAFAVTERPASHLEDVTMQSVVEELTRLYLSDVPDPLTRKALDAVSVVRRATRSLLQAMLPDVAPQDILERLRLLPFVESEIDGLMLHDAVHEAIAASLRASDPSTYQNYRRAAWRQLRSEVRSAGPSELWRYTADILYIVENPWVREAFFPSGRQEFAIEPARPEDGVAIQAIINRHEPPEAANLLKTWWTRLPGSFQTVRGRDGDVAGFSCKFDPTSIDKAFLQDDPIARGVWEHLQHEAIPKNQRALFIRRWLSLEHGEMPSSVQAACFLDCKRTYLELRPNYRRTYATACDMDAYTPVLMKLGFRPLPRVDVRLDGVMYHTAVLDLGPASVDGWLDGLIGSELGVEEGGILDVDARELVLDDQRIGLTPLEFGVMHYLYQHEGKAVTRISLLEDVWGYAYEGGSNVVDTVVRSLRKKLGERAPLIATVRGVGYRFRQG